MRTRLLALPLILIVANGALADTKSEIDAAYTKFNNAIKVKDLKTCMSLCTTDFKWKDKTSTKNRADAEKMLKSQFQLPFTVKKIEHKILSLTEKNGIVTVGSKSVITATAVNPQTSKTATIVSTSESVDTWVKKGKVWLIKAVTEKSNSTTVDGKPFAG
jgi:ketosteroid isomerase-like protein